MDSVTLETRIDAPPATVWRVLDDFGGIERWSPGVRRSRLESTGPVGVGSVRHCDFAPFGSATERIEEHVPGERMRVSLADIRAMPISAADVVFALAPAPDGTRLRFTYSYTVVRPARPFRPLFRFLFRGGLGKLVAGLKEESERLASVGPSSPEPDAG